MALVDGVYDRVPDDADFPYVTLGDIGIRDWSGKTFSGSQCSLQLHIHSREGGRKQSMEIMERLYSLLHDNNISVSGQNMVMMRFLSSDIVLEQDGWSYHGNMRFSLLLQSE